MGVKLATIAADPDRLEHVDREELPALIGEAAALHAVLLARLQAAFPATPEVQSEVPDELLNAAEAADRLGVSKRWIYRKADTLPFTRRLGTNTLRFSARGLERWKESRSR